MKLQKRLSRKYKNKTYYKYLIVLPEDDIIKSGIKEGEELISEVRRGEIVLRKVTSKWKPYCQEQKQKKK